MKTLIKKAIATLEEGWTLGRVLYDFKSKTNQRGHVGMGTNQFGRHRNGTLGKKPYVVLRSVFQGGMLKLTAPGKESLTFLQK